VSPQGYLLIAELSSHCRVIFSLQGPHWNEAQKILKLAVKSSSSLIPATNGHFHSPGTQAIKGLASLYSHTSFAEAEILVKKDLPGTVSLYLYLFISFMCLYFSIVYQMVSIGNSFYS